MALRNTLELGRPTEARRESLTRELTLHLHQRERTIARLRLQRSAVQRITSRLLDSLPSRPPSGVEPERFERARASLGRTTQEVALAKVELTQHNLRLVVALAKRYRHLGVPLADLIQEGNIGLMRAVEKYDHHYGTRFSTYAAWWIKQSIRLALSGQGGTIRIPHYVASQMQAIERAREQLTSRLGRAPHRAELAAEIGVSVAKLQISEEAQLATVSLDAPIHPQSEVLRREVVSDHEHPFDAFAARYDDRRRAQRLLEQLEPRERRVLRLRLGFDGDKPHTLREIGALLRLTPERIRQIEAQALEKLQKLTAESA